MQGLAALMRPSKIKMPKCARSVGKQNIEAGEKERGSGEETSFVANIPGENVKNAGEKKILSSFV